MKWAQLGQTTCWAVEWGLFSVCAGSKLEGVKGGMAISWEQFASLNDPQDFLSPSIASRWSEFWHCDFGIHIPFFSLPGKRRLSVWTLTEGHKGIHLESQSGTKLWGLHCQDHAFSSITSKDFFFFLGCAACGILVARSGIEPMTLALEAWRLNHWAAREVLEEWRLETGHEEANQSWVGWAGGYSADWVGVVLIINHNNCNPCT